MKAEEVIRMWRQGYSKNKIVEEYSEGYLRKISMSSKYDKKPSMREIRLQSAREVEHILLDWWKKEVLEK